MSALVLAFKRPEPAPVKPAKREIGRWGLPVPITDDEAEAWNRLVALEAEVAPGWRELKRLTLEYKAMTKGVAA